MATAMTGIADFFEIEELDLAKEEFATEVFPTLSNVEQAIEHGWLDEAARGEIAARLRTEGSDTSCFSGTTYCEVVARMP